MSYRMRVYALSDDSIPVSQLQARLQDEGIEATFEVDPGDENCWTAIILTHKDNAEPIASIDRELVLPDSLADQEIEELFFDRDPIKPPSARRYLEGFLQRVKAAYIFQILNGADRADGWEAIHTVQGQLIEELGGVLHADLEGFSNEDGYHITWEFVGSVTGEWTMAVLDPNDRWIAFRMNLGNKKHRKAFCEGRVPPGLKTWDAGPAHPLSALK